MSVKKWLAVSAGGDSVKLLPLEGTGPDFFVKLADYERQEKALQEIASCPAHDELWHGQLQQIAREALETADSATNETGAT